ncbi:hypothetical protein [Methyloraptor flagellatus]|uniref:Lectin-like protein BA14k n=1 Tax=Methyloraptor flagellatus TaxID=3162530 RepID=A0AAU7XEY7_9HYPH
MNRFVAAAVAALTLTAASFAPVSQARAGDEGAIAAGIVGGLILGGVIAQAAQASDDEPVVQQRYVEPAPRYTSDESYDRPRYTEPYRSYGGEARYERRRYDGDGYGYGQRRYDSAGYGYAEQPYRHRHDETARAYDDYGSYRAPDCRRVYVEDYRGAGHMRRVCR